jgi:hypothetical protein
MYKFAIAILLLSTPAFAQDKYQPPMPPDNMKKYGHSEVGGRADTCDNADNGRGG